MSLCGFYDQGALILSGGQWTLCHTIHYDLTIEQKRDVNTKAFANSVPYTEMQDRCV